MNRGERAKHTKAAKHHERTVERRSVMRLIENHRDMLVLMLDENSGKIVGKLLTRLRDHISWGNHREDRS